MAVYKNALNEISFLLKQWISRSWAANTFVPDLTFLSLSLQNMDSVKTCGSWRSQECPVEMFMPNVSAKADTDLYVLA